VCQCFTMDNKKGEIRKNLIIIFIFLLLNLLLLILESRLTEEYFSILRGVWVVALFSTVIFYNHKILEGVERPSQKYTIKLLGILGLFAFNYILIIIVSLYLILPVIISLYPS